MVYESFYYFRKLEKLAYMLIPNDFHLNIKKYESANTLTSV